MKLPRLLIVFISLVLLALITIPGCTNSDPAAPSVPPEDSPIESVSGSLTFPEG